MKTPIPEPVETQPIVAEGYMVPHFRNIQLRIVRFLNGGTSEKAYRAVSATDAFTVDDYCIECTSGTFTVNTPSVSKLAPGREFVLKNSGAGTITLATPGSETIDGSATQSVTAGNSIQIMFNGTNFLIIG